MEFPEDDDLLRELYAGGYTESEIAVLQQAFDIVFSGPFGEEEGEAAVNRRERIDRAEEEVVQVPQGAVLGGEAPPVEREVGPPTVLIIPPESERESPSPLPVRRGEHEVLDEVRADLFEAAPVFALFSPIRSRHSFVVEDGDHIDEGKCQEEDRRSTGVSHSIITEMEI